MKKRLVILLALLIAGAGIYKFTSSTDTEETNQTINVQQDNQTQIIGLSPEQVISQPTEFIDKKIALTGKLYIEVNCPPGSATVGPHTECSSSAYLINSTSEQPAAVPKLTLYRNGSVLGCLDPTNKCGDLEDGKIYDVSGTLKYFSSGDRQFTNMVILEVDTIRPL